MTVDVNMLLAATGGSVVGKVRLQKLVYLLDASGLQSGFSYDYHHYGPYAEGLADAVDVKVIQGEVVEEMRRRQSDGVPYSVFKSSRPKPAASDRVGNLVAADVARIGAVTERYSATVMELAATIRWLIDREQVANWRAELVRRKGVKTQNGRTEEALNLLLELGLPVES